MPVHIVQMHREMKLDADWSLSIKGTTLTEPGVEVPWDEGVERPSRIRLENRPKL